MQPYRQNARIIVCT